MNYNDINTLNDDDEILVKTTLLLFVYSYYEEENLLTPEIKKIFKRIFSIVKVNRYRNDIEPPYFKMEIKDIKKLFAKAPYDIYTNASFKLEPKTKSK